MTRPRGPRPEFDLLFGFVEFGDEEAMLADPSAYGVTDPRSLDEVSAEIVERVTAVLFRWPG